MASSDEEDFTLSALADSTRPETSLSDKNCRTPNMGLHYIELPKKSREIYEITYNKYIKWNKSDQPFSEDTLIKYFNELSVSKKPTYLWSIFSMLKATIWLKHRANIGQYRNLLGLIKKLNIGIKPTRAPALPEDGIERFLNEAPDYNYLVLKVALIFALSGANKCLTLLEMKTKHIEEQGEMLLIKYSNTNPKNWSAPCVIQGANYHIVKKYQALRPKHTKHDRFFLQYRKGKCFIQPIGKNAFCDMPKKIAKYLGLPNPELYTGHSFKQTYMARQARVTGVYKHNIKEKKTITLDPPLKIEFEPNVLNSDDNSSDDPHNEEQDPFSSRESSMSPVNEPDPNSHPDSQSIEEDIKIFADSFSTPRKRFTFNFNNCRFSRCFNK